MSNGNQLFDENAAQALVVQRDDAAVARATQEVQAALVIAARYPRDEIKARSRIMAACQRKELAEVAEYEYSRNGTRITGPTVDLLRAIANRWGNIRFGWTEVDRREGMSSVRCFAWDVQSNGQSERTFSVKHWRDTKGGGYELTDERDIYEMIANSAARRVRACLEEVIDADVVTAAIDQCRLTMKSGEKIPITDRAVKMLVPFAEFGVTQAMIETRLGHKLEAVSENELASLRRIYKSLKDGVGNREDHFKPEMVKPEFNTPTPTPVTTNAPSVAHTTPPVASDPVSPLKALRHLLAADKVKENVLMDFLASTGKTDGSDSSLEEIQLSKPDLISWMVGHWGDFYTEIKSKGGDK